MNHNVLSFLEEQAVASPGRIALWGPPRQPSSRPGGRSTGTGGLGPSLTYGELDRRTRELCGALSQLGVVPDDRVLLLVPLSIELYLVLLAVMRMGAAAVVVDPSLGLSNLSRLAPELQLKALVAAGPALWLRHMPGLRSVPLHLSVTGRHGRRLRSLAELVRRGAPPLATVPVQPRTPALVTFTSGSTGRPRGTSRSHGFLRTQQRILGGHLGIGRADVDCSSLPIFLLNSLAVGATCVLPAVDGAGRADGQLLLRQIETCRVSTLSGPPGFFEPLVRLCLRQGRSLQQVRALFTGGAPVLPTLLEELERVFPCAEIEVVYGSTEAEPIASISGPEARALSAERYPRGQGLCLGSPVPQCSVALLPVGEPDGLRPERQVPPGQIGEVVVAGEHVNRGYLNAPEEEARTKLLDAQGQLWHRTGDLAWRDERGRLWLTGRLADRVRLPDGTSVDSLELRGLLDGLPMVRRATLLTLAQSGSGSRDGRPILVVEQAEAGLLSLLLNAAGWSRRIAERLAERGICGVRTIYLPELPLDRRHRSRIDRRKLRAELKSCRWMT